MSLSLEESIHLVVVAHIRLSLVLGDSGQPILLAMLQFVLRLLEDSRRSGTLLHQIPLSSLSDFGILLPIVHGLVDESATLVHLRASFSSLWLIANASWTVVFGSGNVSLSTEVHHLFGTGDSTAFEPSSLLILKPVEHHVVFARWWKTLGSSCLNIVEGVGLVFPRDADAWDPVNRLVLSSLCHSVVWNSDLGLLLLVLDLVSELHHVRDRNAISCHAIGTFSDDLFTGLGSFSTGVRSSHGSDGRSSNGIDEEVLLSKLETGFTRISEETVLQSVAQLGLHHGLAVVWRSGSISLVVEGVKASHSQSGLS